MHAVALALNLLQAFELCRATTTRIAKAVVKPFRVTNLAGHFLDDVVQAVLGSAAALLNDTALPHRWRQLIARPLADLSIGNTLGKLAIKLNTVNHHTRRGSLLNFSLWSIGHQISDALQSVDLHGHGLVKRYAWEYLNSISTVCIHVGKHLNATIGQLEPFLLWYKLRICSERPILLLCLSRFCCEFIDHRRVECRSNPLRFRRVSSDSIHVNLRQDASQRLSSHQAATRIDLALRDLLRLHGDIKSFALDLGQIAIAKA